MRELHDLEELLQPTDFQGNEDVWWLKRGMSSNDGWSLEKETAGEQQTPKATLAKLYSLLMGDSAYLLVDYCR